MSNPGYQQCKQRQQQQLRLPTSIPIVALNFQTSYCSCCSHIPAPIDYNIANLTIGCPDNG